MGLRRRPASIGAGPWAETGGGLPPVVDDLSWRFRNLCQPACFHGLPSCHRYLSNFSGRSPDVQKIEERGDLEVQSSKFKVQSSKEGLQNYGLRHVGVSE